MVQNQRIMVQTRPPRPWAVVNKTQPKAPLPQDGFGMNIYILVAWLQLICLNTARKRETFATYSKLTVRAHNVQCQTLSYLSTCFGRDAPTLRKAKIAELKREHGHSKPALSLVKVVRDNNANDLSLLADPEVLRSKLQFASEEQATLNILVSVCLCTWVVVSAEKKRSWSLHG